MYIIGQKRILGDYQVSSTGPSKTLLHGKHGSTRADSRNLPERHYAEFVFVWLGAVDAPVAHTGPAKPYVTRIATLGSRALLYQTEP